MKTSRVWRPLLLAQGISWLVVLPPSDWAQAHSVNIPDPALEGVIRETLGKPAGEISASDLERLTRLDARARGITSLEGLGAAKNLTVLDLRANGFSQLDIPTGLVNLTTLDLSVNQLTAVTFPADLGELTGLNLAYNHLLSLTLPVTLDKLQHLDLTDNHISDFSFLAGRSHLISLNLFGNDLAELILPPGLGNLQELNLGSNHLTDFSFLADLRNLTTLVLYDNDLSTVKLPPALDNLRELNLGANHLADFTFLTRLQSLESLDLSNNQLTSLALPPDLSNLRDLNLSGNHLTDISFLAGRSSLETLNLRANQLARLSLPAGLTSLTTLSVGVNLLTDLSFVSGLNTLQTLDLAANQFTDLKLPENLSSLTTLDVAFNQLTTLTVPLWLSDLTELGLAGNPLTDFAIPAGNTNLASTVTQLQATGVRVTTLPVLMVASSNPNSGVSIVVSPADNDGRGNGITEFGRVYTPGTTVTLTAPPTAAGRTFQKWQRDGTDFDSNPTTTVAMDSSHVLAALYGPAALAPKNVAEAADYLLAYSLSVPDQADFNRTGVPWDVDNHASLAPFCRIAYYLELQTITGASQYLWASMNAFTHDSSKIGVPTIQSGAFFQQPVWNMNVRSSEPEIIAGDHLSGGNLEFWWGNYGKNNAANVPGASSTLYDFGDQASPNDPAGYGSMQVHNSAAGQTLFALNAWGEASFLDLGIGNSPGKYPDWTFAGNAASYPSKVLQIYVLPTPLPAAQQNVPEARNYTLVYSLNVPDEADFNRTGVPWDIDNHASIGAFSRIAYYLELQSTAGSTQYLWVSMDAFTTDVNKIGVPSIQTGAFFQQPITNMNVRSSEPGIVTGDGMDGGWLEFWWSNYGKNNAAHVPGASNSLYDFGDQASSGDPAGYGSMQVHNAAAGQTLFALNAWGTAPDLIDIGIGNCPGKYTDWTFAANAASFLSKVLQVYVLPTAQPHAVP